MAEPVSPTVSSFAGLAFILTTLTGLGITDALVTWGAVGAFIGHVRAPADLGRVRSALVYVAASLLSAKGGAILGETASLSANLAQGAAALLGIAFHPLSNAAAGKLVDAVKALPLKRSS